jgi:hypothetical protein
MPGRGDKGTKDRAAKETKSVFCRGVYVAENTSKMNGSPRGPREQRAGQEIWQNTMPDNLI